MAGQPASLNGAPRLDSVAAIFAVGWDQRIVSSTAAAVAALGGRPLDGRPCYEVMCALDSRNGAQCRPDCIEIVAARGGRTPKRSSFWDGACQQPRPLTTFVEERDGVAPLIIHVIHETNVPVAIPAVYSSPERLTHRQVETLRLLARGVPPRDIARMLGVSPVTIRNHIQTAMERLGARTRLEAVMIASRAGIV